MIPGTNDVPGCMDETALNYDPAATLSDGSCYYTGEVCEAPFDFLKLVGPSMVHHQQLELLDLVRNFILLSPWIKHGRILAYL